MYTSMDFAMAVPSSGMPAKFILHIGEQNLNIIIYIAYSFCQLCTL